MSSSYDCIPWHQLSVALLLPTAHLDLINASTTLSPLHRRPLDLRKLADTGAYFQIYFLFPPRSPPVTVIIINY